MRFDLLSVPAGAVAQGVVAEASTIDGVDALRVSLDETVRAGIPGVDFVDQPTFLVLPVTVAAGRVSVRIRSSVLPDAPDYARGFAGIAFRVTDETFESVYVRPYNGVMVAPDGPRRHRAVQYFSFPEWPFDRLREERPDAGYEASADIAPDTWARLLVEFGADGVRAEVDGATVIDLDHALADEQAGRIGLWVDIGTDAWFADLEIEVRG